MNKRWGWNGLIIFFILLSFTAVFYPVIPSLIERFTARDSYYSHGFLIPFITLYLIWRKRNVLKAIPKESDKSGLFLIIPALLIYLLSQFFKINFISYMTIPFVMGGITLFLFGRPFTKQILAPLVFLVFMLPLPQVIIIGVTFKMKIFAAELSNFFMNYMGLKTMVEGAKIIYPGGQLWVGDPCSGLRSLISFIALGAFIVQVVETQFWKKSFLFVSTIPIAIVSNVARIIVLTVGSYIYGETFSTGIMHDITGIMVFIIGFICLILMMSLLKCQISIETV